MFSNSSSEDIYTSLRRQKNETLENLIDKDQSIFTEYSSGSLESVVSKEKISNLNDVLASDNKSHNLIFKNQSDNEDLKGIVLEVSVHEIMFDTKKCKMIVSHNINDLIENL